MAIQNNQSQSAQSDQPENTKKGDTSLIHEVRENLFRASQMAEPFNFSRLIAGKNISPLLRLGLSEQSAAKLTRVLAMGLVASLFLTFAASIITLFIAISLFFITPELTAAALMLASGTVLSLSAWSLYRLILREDKDLENNQLVEQLNQQVEHFSDVQWELRDSESRYRDLLDCQNDIIIRRDKNGALTYKNSAFTKQFGNALGSEIGSEFKPKILDGNETPPLEFEQGQGRRRYTQRLATPLGVRWFTWEEFAIRDRDLNIIEIQSIGRDVTEQRQVEDELQKARDQALSASRAKGQFLATMSHEIRTPMNGILGMTGLMMDTEITAEQKTYCRAINSSTKSLLSLIDQILDFSKIEAGKLELENQSLDIREIAQSVIELLAPRAHDKNLQISWYIDPTLPQTLQGDEVRLRQIFTNLIGNAIKFTASGGVTIDILDSEKKDYGPEYFARPRPAGRQKIRIKVRDTGVGISRAAQKTIFSEFEQGDSSHARRYGGTGLGLSITKKIIEKMNGSIEVRSEQDEGAEFIVEIELNRSKNTGHLYQSYQLPELPHRVLIVGSIELEMRTIARTLNASGITCNYRDGAAALKELTHAGKTAQPYDVLIMDAATAKNRGQKLMKELGTELEANNSKMLPRKIVLIEASERGEFPGLHANGVDAYLTRPVRAISLFARINTEYSSTIPRDMQQTDAPQSNGDEEYSDETAPTILLAEDNEINALLARTILEKLGAKVDHVTNGEAAYERVKHLNKLGQKLDYILMDIHMPEMDGFTATKKIRSYLARYSRSISTCLPIIALTANAFAEDKEQCLRAGMDDHLAKPFEQDQLKEILEKCKRQQHAIESEKLVIGAN